ncbi:MAG: N-acetylmuramoyl-L-alanine amidase [Patescibacteria group bacterium]|nr:N-acetylmuramoyl-L-alanine amidase [Patescibacteria group bacterium]
MKNIFIDTGHSKRFPGASGLRSEVDWVRTICAALVPLLNKSKWSIQLVPDAYGSADRTSTSNLLYRIAWINKRAKDGDWLLSIHANGWTNAKANGIETCYMGGSEYMHKKAIELSTIISKATGMRLRDDGSYPDNRPTSSGRARIAMVRDTRPPALLVECGFVTNPQDMAVKPALIAKSIADFFNGPGI